MNQNELLDRIVRLAGNFKYDPQSSKHEVFAYDHDAKSIYEVQRIRHALINTGTGDERNNLVVDLFRLWWERRERSCEAREVFGPLMFLFDDPTRAVSEFHPIVTVDTWEKVRVWFGPPHNISSRYVNSAGSNLLFEGASKDVILHLCTIAKLHKFTSEAYPGQEFYIRA